MDQSASQTCLRGTHCGWVRLPRHTDQDRHFLLGISGENSEAV
jgi:hypothetical protein